MDIRKVSSCNIYNNNKKKGKEKKKKGKRSSGEENVYPSTILRIQSLPHKPLVVHGRETWCLNLREEYN